MDIGVSSMQLDQAERGFAFSNDGPLDMRMSQSGQTAAEFLNEADEAEIARVIRDYGEEPRARKVAHAIVAARPLTRTAELAAVVRKALGHHAGMKSDPATRTFQAIRIHLNAELDELEAGAARRRALAAPRRAARGRHLPQPRGPHRQALPARRAAAPPRPDRATARWRRPVPARVSNKSPSRCPRRTAELARNPRARSARLRTAVRTDAPAWDQEKAA